MAGSMKSVALCINCVEVAVKPPRKKYGNESIKFNIIDIRFPNNVRNKEKCLLCSSHIG